MSSKQELRQKLESTYGAIPDEVWDSIDQELGNLDDYDEEEEYLESAGKFLRIARQYHGAIGTTQQDEPRSHTRPAQSIGPLKKRLELLQHVRTWRAIGEAEMALGIRSKQYTWAQLAELYNAYKGESRTDEALAIAYKRVSEEEFPDAAMRFASRFLFGSYESERAKDTSLLLCPWLREQLDRLGFSVIEEPARFWFNDRDRGLLYHEMLRSGPITTPKTTRRL